MAVMQNPFGLRTVTPYLLVEGAQQTIDFAIAVFDATLRGAVRLREDGTVQHAELALGDSVIMIGEPMGDMPGMPGMLYVYVDDCEKRFQMACDAGAIALRPIEVYPHGDRYGGVKDEAGNVWWIVTHEGTESE